MTRFLALTLLIGFFAFLPSASADGENGLHITPADVHQSASSGTAILTLNVSNIQVRAKWRLDGDPPFAINDNGELRLTATLSDPATIVATVIVEDMFSELNRNYQNLAATAFITVEFILDTLTATVRTPEPLILADAPPLTVTVINATVSLHTFTASGGLGTLTYALIGDNTLHFSIDERGGVLRIDETATMGIYTLSVEVSDGAIIPQRATVMAIVTVVETLFLADAPPLTATVINATVSLHTFTASGGLGTLTYALIGDNTLHFSIDERDGVLRIDETATMGIYTLSVEVADGVMTPQKATAVATVTVVETLFLADAPPLTVTVINATVSLHTFTASGGLGTLTYALIGDNTLHFSIDERGGVLRIDETATMGIYTLSVEVSDGVMTPQKATAVATVTVEMLEPLILADAPPLTVTVINATVSLHTFTASGGLGTLTYALIGDNTLHFSIDERGGILRIDETATVGIYTLSVEVSDEVIIPQRATAMATVAVVATVAIEIEGTKLNTLTLKAKVSDRARDLHVFNVPYANAYSIVAGNDDGYFTIGKTSGTLAVQAWAPVGNYPLSIGIIYTFSLGIPPKVVVSAVVVEIIDYPTPTQSKIYVLGGSGNYENGSPYRNDVWSSVNGINWGLETSSAVWSGRDGHQALSHNGKIYVLGGRRWNDTLNDVWSSVNGINWSLETSAAWPRRDGHQALSYNGRLYVLGGDDDFDNKNDVWSSVNGTNWSLETSSAAWLRRYGHQALSHNGRMYVLGGARFDLPLSFSSYNDVWSSVNGINWSLETSSAAWSGRSYHQALSHNGKIYVLGGSGGNDVWSSVDGKIWMQETDGAGWSERSAHQAALSHNGRIYVLGGYSSTSENGSRYRNDVWSSADGKNWLRETDDAGWSGRNEHQAVVFPSPLVLFGISEKITMTAGIEVNNLHSFTVANGTGNYTYSLEPVVDGFAVSSDGVLSADGTAMAGAYIINVFVADEKSNKGQTAIRINVIRLSLSFLDASEEWTLPDGHAGVLHTLTASGGYGDYTYTVSPPGSGFVIDANGVLSADGTATPGEYTITVEVADEINSKTATWTGKVIII